MRGTFHQPHPGEGGSADETAHTSSPPAVSEQPLVLIVEDDEGTREVLGMALEEEGYRVTVARHGAEALDRLEKELPAVVLMDLRMPVMSGRELFDRLRAQYPDLPLILLSADRRIEVEPWVGDAAGFMVKPFDLDDLVRVVQQCISGSAP